MTNTEGGLLLIVAYRDLEVNAANPLMLTIDEIKQTKAIVNHIYHPKSVLKSLLNGGRTATPVALSRGTRPTHWLNFSQNLKSKMV